MSLLVVPSSGSSDTAASQAEMEAATDLTKFVSPGRLKYHPGTAKAWVTFDGSGTVTILTSYNVSSVTDNNPGDYTVNFTTAFSSDTYCCVGAIYPNAFAYGTASFIGGATAKTSSSSSRHRTIIGAVIADPDVVDLQYYGDQ